MGKITIALPLFAVAVLAAPVVSASVLRVPEGYRNIRQAVDAAEQGDVIIVGAGNYSENIVIRKAVQLRSIKGPEATVVTAAVKTEPVFKIDHAAKAVVSGFTATGSSVSGFSLHNADASRILDNRAVKNGSGILVYSSSANHITGNAADSNTQYGIYLEASTGNTVMDNSADMNGDTGIFLSSSNSNLLSGNSANVNTWNGILLWSSHRNAVKGNKVLRNAFSIVESDSDGNDVGGNTTFPNFVLILPVILIYAGIVFYLIQKNILRKIYKV
ncbi:MAG: right-handed parallel beta-helix repeat-containing protein [Deltaproteobacteria bacterium]|nr:right-handed parallel beta-helix repeat-containing protein [Deltaproteobacteria bacterium]